MADGRAGGGTPRTGAEINFQQLELARLEAQIEAAAGAGGTALVDLQRRRGELAEQIARRDTT